MLFRSELIRVDIETISRIHQEEIATIPLKREFEWQPSKELYDEFSKTIKTLAAIVLSQLPIKQYKYMIFPKSNQALFYGNMKNRYFRVGKDEHIDISSEWRMLQDIISSNEHLF